MERITNTVGAWSATEDEVLKAAVGKYGKKAWARVGSMLVRKSARQCKERWYEQVNPDINRSEWTRAEDEKLKSLAEHSKLSWFSVAEGLGRPPSMCVVRHIKLLDSSERSAVSGNVCSTSDGATAANKASGFPSSHKDSRALFRMMRGRAVLTSLILFGVFLVVLALGPTKWESTSMVVGEPRRLSESSSKKPFRILHIITSLNHKSTLGRGMVFGSSRLDHIMYLLRGVVDLCKSGVGPDYEVQVGVQIIAGWDAEKSRPEFEKVLADCGDRIDLKNRLFIWENAIPMKMQDGKMAPYPRALAKQHRFVIKRELENYDMFSAWEDDIYVGASHYQHFLERSAELDSLAELYPDPSSKKEISMNSWKTELTAMEYQKILPGYVRVETALVGETEATGAFRGDAPCCPLPHPEAHVHKNKLEKEFRQNELLAWEWGVDGMGVLYLPEPFDGWVAAVPARSGGWLRSFTGQGPNGELAANHLGPDRFGQQAGWMATKEQIARFEHYCAKGFLPPAEEHLEHWFPSGNVEFWSGGFHLFGGNRCRVARVLDLRSPEAFLKHMVFHSGNNKQVQRPDRMQSVEKIYNGLMKLVEKAKRAQQETS